MKSSLATTGPAEVPSHPAGDFARAKTVDRLIGREHRSVGLGTHDINETVMPPDPIRGRWCLVCLSVSGLRSLCCAQCGFRW